MPNITIPRGWGGGCHLRMVAPREIISCAWPEKAASGKEVTLTVKARGFVDGTGVTITIRPAEGEGEEESLSATLSGGVAETTWSKEIETEGTAWSPDSEPQPLPAHRFIFEAEIEGRKKESGILSFQERLEIVAERSDDSGEAAGASYVAVLPDGSQRTGRLDEAGMAFIDDLPPCEVVVYFPEMGTAEVTAEESLDSATAAPA